MSGTIAAAFHQQELDNNGDPLSGGLVYTYEAGTSTPLSTYTDATLGTANANPTVCDSAGRYAMYFGPYSYKVIVKTPAGATLYTRDVVAAVPATNVDLDISGTAGTTLSAGDSVYMSAGDGGLTAGSWYKTDADFTYASSLAKTYGFVPSAISSGNVGSIRKSGRITGLSGLTAGTVYYASATAGGITSSAPANALAVGQADSTSSIVFPIGADVSDLTADVVALQTLTANAQGSQATIDARLDVLLQADGKIVSPVTETITQTAGTGTHTGRVSMFFDSITAAVANSGAGETTVWTKSLPANSLNVDGKCMRVVVWGDVAAVATTKTLRFKFGATTVTVVTDSFNNGAYQWTAQVFLTRRTGTTQEIGSMLSFDPAAGVTNTNTNSTAAETLSGAVTVIVTVQATNTSDITVQGLFADIL